MAATYTQNSTDTEQTHTNIHASSGIRTHDPNVWAGEDSSCLRLRIHWDRHCMYPLGDHNPFGVVKICIPLNAFLAFVEMPVCGRCILMLLTNIHVSSSARFFSTAFTNRVDHVFLVCAVRLTCPPHIRLSDLTVLIVPCFLCNYLHFIASSSL
jgi:hypothetical protein